MTVPVPNTHEEEGEAWVLSENEEWVDPTEGSVLTLILSAAEEVCPVRTKN